MQAHVEGLRHRDERNAGPVEQFDPFRDVRQGTGETVDLVHTDDVDTPRSHLGQLPLQGGAFERSAGGADVIVPGGQQAPALVCPGVDLGCRVA